MQRRRTQAAACAFALLATGVSVAGFGSAGHHTAAAASLPSAQPTIVNTTAGHTEAVALTTTDTTDTTGTVASSTVTGVTATSPGSTTNSVTSTIASTVTSASDLSGIGVTSGNITQLGRPFASDSPWNTPLTGQQIASNSKTLINDAKQRFGVETGNNGSLENLTTGLTSATGGTTTGTAAAAGACQTTEATATTGSATSGTAGTSGTLNSGDQASCRQLSTNVFINTTVWTDPIELSNGGQQIAIVCRQVNLPPPHNDCGDGWQVTAVTVPNTGFPKPAYDGWLTVIDQNAGYAYDFWRARLQDGVMTYQFMRRWTLDGPGFLAPNYPSARGSGLPMFAGEILPSDIKSGHINHALAISIPGPASRFYVQPASSTDGNGAFGSLPEGARIRLNPAYNITAELFKLKKQGGVSLKAAREILVALKTYGAIVVDRSAVPTLYAVPNYDWSQPLKNSKGQYLSPDGTTVLPAAYQFAKYATPLLSANTIADIKLDDFQVMKLGQILEFPPANGTTQAGGVDGVAGETPNGGKATTAALSTTGSTNANLSTGVGTGVP